VGVRASKGDKKTPNSLTWGNNRVFRFDCLYSLASGIDLIGRVKIKASKKNLISL